MWPPAATGSPDCRCRGSARLRGKTASRRRRLGGRLAAGICRRAPDGGQRRPRAPRAESGLLPGLSGPRSPAGRRRRRSGGVARCPCRRHRTRAGRRRRGRGPPRDRGPGGRFRDGRGQRLFRETAGNVPVRRTAIGGAALRDHGPLGRLCRESGALSWGRTRACPSEGGPAMGVSTAAASKALYAVSAVPVPLRRGSGLTSAGCPSTARRLASGAGPAAPEHRSPPVSAQVRGPAEPRQRVRREAALVDPDSGCAAAPGSTCARYDSGSSGLLARGRPRRLARGCPNRSPA